MDAPLVAANVTTTAEINVGSTSPPAKVAGAIANLVRENRAVRINVIGAPAVNQAVKAIPTANSYLASDGMKLIVLSIGFDEILMREGETESLRTRVQILVVAAPAVEVRKAIDQVSQTTFARSTPNRSRFGRPNQQRRQISSCPR